MRNFISLIICSEPEKVGLYMFDVTVHSAIVFGWSSISQIMKENEFFLDLNSSDGLIEDLKNASSLQATENSSCFVVNEEQGGQSKVRGSTNWYLTTYSPWIEPSNPLLEYCTDNDAMYKLVWRFYAVPRIYS